MNELIDVGLLLEAKTQGEALLENFSHLLGGVAAAAAGAALAVGGALAATLIAAGENVIHQAESLDKLSAAYGVSTTAIQQWHGMLKLAGNSTESFDSAMQMVSRRLGTIHNQFLATGKIAPNLIQPFKELGLTAMDLAHSTPDVVIGKILEGLGKIPNATDRAFIGARTLGGAWKDLFDVYEQSGHNLDAFRQKVDASGYVLDEAAIKKAQEAAAAQHELSLQFDGLKNMLGVAMIPVFQLLSGIIRDNMGTFKTIATFIASELVPGFLKWAKDAMPEIIAGFKIFMGILGVVFGIFQTAWPVIKTIVTSVFNAITGAVQSSMPQIKEIGTVFVRDVIPGVMAFISAVAPVLVPLIKEVLVDAFRILAAIMTNVVGPAFRFLADHQKELKDIAQALGIVIHFVLVTAMNVVAAAITAVSAVVMTLTWFFSNLRQALDNGAIIWHQLGDILTNVVVGAFNKVGGVLITVKQGFDTFINFLKNNVMGVLDAIGEKAKVVGEALSFLDPNKRRSPSLVDKIALGTQQIKDMYSALGKDMSMTVSPHFNAAMGNAPGARPAAATGAPTGGTDTFVQRLVILQTEANKILNAIAAKDLRPAVNKEIAGHLSGARA